MPNMTSKGLVPVMNSIVVMMGEAWVKYEVRGSGSPSSSWVWTQKKMKNFAFFMSRGIPTGTRTQSVFGHISFNIVFAQNWYREF